MTLETRIYLKAYCTATGLSRSVAESSAKRRKIPRSQRSAASLALNSWVGRIGDVPADLAESGS